MIQAAVIKLAMAAGLGLACAAGGWWAGARHVRADWDAEKVQQLQAQAEADQKAQAATQETTNAYLAQTRRVRAAADAARSDLDRLRDVIATGAACPAAAASGADGTGDASGTVVNECAAALSAMAATLDDREARLTALQGWVRALETPP